MYTIPRLNKEEYETLIWLSCRGYDGGILAVAGIEEEHDDGGATLGTIEEHEACEVKEFIDADTDAFLTCNGSSSLGDKLVKFYTSIV